MYKRCTFAAIAVLAAVVSVWPTGAMAADTFAGFFESIPQGDYSLTMLQRVFPELFGGSGTTALAEAFRTFNAGLLLLASAMVGWFTLLGIVSTAHEGKVLGQQWHQIWAPVRVAMGIAMVAPTPSGYCAGQMVVAQLTQWGLGFANSVWGTYVTAIASGAPTATPDIQGSYEVIRDIAMLEACYAAMKEHEAAIRVQGGRFNTYVTPGTFYENKPVVGDMVNVEWHWKYGDACGHIEVTKLQGEGWVPWKDYSEDNMDGRRTGASAQEAHDAQVKAGRAIEAKIGEIKHNAIAEKLNEAKKEAINNAIAALRGPIEEYMARPNMKPEDVKTTISALSAVIRQQVEAYDQKMLEAAKEGVKIHEGQVRSAFEAFAKDSGWASAGSYYILMSKYTGDVFAMLNAGHTPDVTPLDDMRKRMIHGNSVPVHADALTQFSQILKEAALDSNKVSALATEGLIGGFNGNRDWEDAALYSLGGSIFMGFIEKASQMDSNDPLGHMIGFGHMLITVAQGAIVVTAIAMGAKEAFDKGSYNFIGGAIKKVAKWTPKGKVVSVAFEGLKAVAKFMTPYIFTAILAILIIGIVHAFVLPMLPYIVWLTALVGWFIFVMEAMVAAPIWALTHCRFDGANLIDQAQRQGYMLAFNLFLRPVLMLLGLMLSLAAYGALIQYVNNTMLFAIKQTTSGHLFGIVTTLVMLGLITYVQYQLATKTFSLIYMVPDRVARWFGAGAEQLGEQQDSDKAVAVMHQGLAKGEGATQSAMMRTARGGDGKTPGKDLDGAANGGSSGKKTE